MRAERNRGLTLLELIISISIVAILGMVAVPSFVNLRQDSERAAAVNRFVHALYLARSESIKRGAIVSICKSADGRNCSHGADWNGGWMVFSNDDRDDLPDRDANEDILSVYEGWPAGHISSNRSAYSFRPYQQSVVNGTLVFCDARGSASARAIIISQTGRPRVAQRDSSNRPLRCP
jgi:type IV fimbrial biogenesis protein FimT